MKKFNDLYKDVTGFYASNAASDEYEVKKHLKDLINQVETLIKPAFVLVVNLRDNNKPLIFEKNYSLITDKDGTVTADLILNSLNPEQLNKLIELDKLSAIFTSKFYENPFKYFMNVSLPVELVKGKKQLLLRTGMVISHASDGKPNFALAYFKDITKVAQHTDVIKFFISGGGENDQRLIELEEKINLILDVNLKLTKQEKNVLQHIKNGDTSLKIAEKLFITKSTVDTHRQNIIKKFEVNNCAAAVNKAVEYGIID